MPDPSKALTPVNPSVRPAVEAAVALDVTRARELIRPLSPAKRRFLRVRALYESDAEAAASVGYSANQVKNWRRRDPDFQAAYEAILVDPVLHAVVELSMLAPKAVGVVDDMLGSSDPRQKKAAVEMVLKANRLLGGVEVNINDNGPSDPYLARLAALRRQRAMPVGGISGVTDGEWREVEASEAGDEENAG